MIKVIFNRQFYRLTVSGHAGSGPKGHDLVCAAASAIALTLAGNVAHLEAQEAVHGVTIKMEEGNAEIQCTPYRQHKNTVMLILQSVCMGFELLSTKYPDHISYDVRG